MGDDPYQYQEKYVFDQVVGRSQAETIIGDIIDQKAGNDAEHQNIEPGFFYGPEN